MPDSFFFFSLKSYLFTIYYIYSVLPACQKGAPDIIMNICGPPYGCWELNSGPLEEQPVLLITEPSLQPPTLSFYELCVDGRCYFVNMFLILANE